MKFENIEELIQENKFSEYLMANKVFVEGAKKIFNEQNVKMSDESLLKILEEMERNLSETGALNDINLEKISGGLSGNSIAKTVIKIISNAGGAAIFSYLGYQHVGKIGEPIGGWMGSEQWADGPGISKSGYSDFHRHNNDPILIAKGETIGRNVGSFGGGVGGMLIGYKLGEKFGNWLIESLEIGK